MDLPTLLAVAGPTALVTAGTAYGSVKATLNGTKQRVVKLEEDASDLINRMARIEGKIDMLITRVPR